MKHSNSFSAYDAASNLAKVLSVNDVLRSTKFLAAEIGAAGAVLTLCGWRYLPNLVGVPIVSYIIPVPLFFGAAAVLAHREPSPRFRSALLMSASFELVIFVASFWLRSPLDALLVQLTSGMIAIAFAFVGAFSGLLIKAKSRINDR